MAIKTTKSTKTARRTTKKTPHVKLEETSTKTSRVSDQPKIRVKRSYVLAFLIVFVLGALTWIFRSFFVVAIVNGQPIPRVAVIKELERQGGKQALNSLITKTLVAQEAKRRNIIISDKDVQDEIKKIEQEFKKQGRNLDQLLTAQGMTRQRLEEQVRIQKTIEKMLSKDIQVSEKEVQDYMDKNKDSIPQDAKIEDVKKQAQEQLRQQKLSEKFQNLLADLQKKAKINYFVQY